MLYGVAVPSVDRPMDWKETTALNQPFAGPTAYATNPQYWLNVQTGIVVSTSMKLFGHCVINIPSMDVNTLYMNQWPQIEIEQTKRQPSLVGQTIWANC